MNILVDSLQKTSLIKGLHFKISNGKEKMSEEKVEKEFEKNLQTKDSKVLAFAF